MSLIKNFIRLISKLALLSICIFPAQSVSACTVLPQDQAAGGQCIDIKGHQLYIRQAGKQSPMVIFESGMGSDSSSWDKVIPQVSQFARTLTYDRAGLGKSDPMPGNKAITAQEVVNTLRLVLQKENIKPPYILVGHSLGGLYMQYFAREFPQDVKGIVLVDPVTTNLTLSDPLPASSAPYYREAEGIPASRDEVKSAPSFPNIPVIVLIATHHGNFSPAQENLVITDRMRLAKLLPQGKFIIAKGSGHYIQNDQPQLVVDAIRTMVNMTY